MKKGTRVSYQNGEFGIEAVITTAHREGDFTILFTETKGPIKQGDTHRCNIHCLDLIGQKRIDWPEPRLAFEGVESLQRGPNPIAH